MDVSELVHHHASNHLVLSEARDQSVPKGASDYCDSLKRFRSEACCNFPYNASYINK